MFTGLVQTVGETARVLVEGPGRRIVIRAPRIAADCRIGDSIAINGCCLTVVACDEDEFAFEAGPETLERTNLGEIEVGTPVNLETSLKAGDPLGGHLVTGHIDAVGTVRSREDDGEWSTFWFDAARDQIRQMASKGSIAVDGISLTLVDVSDTGFSVALIPHTLTHTTLGNRQPGDRVNLETDVLAKYVQQQLAFRSSP